ncbi:hypothetical protein EV368DRAFT_66898 [Lentinula lateritia]|nr:hypothetical protein EV368DRAFT_66898 [Lentinula lateritia]
MFTPSCELKSIEEESPIQEGSNTRVKRQARLALPTGRKLSAVTHTAAAAGSPDWVSKGKGGSRAPMLYYQHSTVVRAVQITGVVFFLPWPGEGQQSSLYGNNMCSSASSSSSIHNLCSTASGINIWQIFDKGLYCWTAAWAWVSVFRGILSYFEGYYPIPKEITTDRATQTQRTLHNAKPEVGKPDFFCVFWMTDKPLRKPPGLLSLSQLNEFMSTPTNQPPTTNQRIHKPTNHERTTNHLPTNKPTNPRTTESSRPWDDLHLWSHAETHDVHLHGDGVSDAEGGDVVWGAWDYRGGDGEVHRDLELLRVPVRLRGRGEGGCERPEGVHAEHGAGEGREVRIWIWMWMWVWRREVWGGGRERGNGGGGRRRRGMRRVHDHSTRGELILGSPLEIAHEPRNGPPHLMLPPDMLAEVLRSLVVCGKHTKAGGGEWEEGGRDLWGDAQDDWGWGKGRGERGIAARATKALFTCQCTMRSAYCRRGLMQCTYPSVSGTLSPQWPRGCCTCGSSIPRPPPGDQLLYLYLPYQLGFHNLHK